MGLRRRLGAVEELLERQQRALDELTKRLPQMGAPALDVVPGAEQPNDASDPGPTLVPPRLFWAALGVAAIVLVGLIARLLRKQTH